MRAEELRDAVSGICMTEDEKMAVIRNVKERNNGIPLEKQNSKSGKSGRRRKGQEAGWRKNLAAAAIALVVIGIVAVPVKALVNSLVRERMEGMSAEEKETYVDTVKEQKTAADGFSRAYTEQEEARYQALAQKYQEGFFPENEVPQAANEAEASGYEFCYLVPESTFRLPERELTDEEMLQIIDFLVKRDYAYSEAYAEEHAEEIAQEEAQEQAAIDENVEGGGISEERAIEIARQKLKDIFDVTVEGFEQNSYYNEPEEGRRADYCVNWTNIISHKYYYFNIDAQDGHLINATYSGEDILREGQALTMEEVQERILQLQAAAAEVMKNKVGSAYDKVHVYYLQYDDGLVGRSVIFYFTGEDQRTYGIAYTWNGIMFEITERDISALQDGEERQLWNGEANDRATVVFREL